MTDPIIAAFGKFNADLHPRGKDGKFIVKFGSILAMLSKLDNGTSLTNGSGDRNFRGKVVAITPDPKSPGQPDIRMEVYSPDGKSLGFATVKPNKVSAAKEAKARLDFDVADLSPVPEVGMSTYVDDRGKKTDSFVGTDGETYDLYENAGWRRRSDGASLGDDDIADVSPPERQVEAKPAVSVSEPITPEERDARAMIRRAYAGEDIPEQEVVDAGKLIGMDDEALSKILDTQKQRQLDPNIPTPPREETPRMGLGDVPVNDKDFDAMSRTSAGPHIVGRNPDGSPVFTPERQALHDKWIEDQLAGVAVSDDPTFFMLGGGPAAGKSTMLKAGDVDVPNPEDRLAVVVNADEAKEALPEYQEGLANMDPDAASFVHEESSYLAKRLQAAAIERGLDVVLDGTGDSSPDSLRGKIEAARKKGYKVKGFYATVPTDVAVERSDIRFSDEGRFVPEKVVRTTHVGVSGIFEEVAADFDEVQLFDTTNGAVPIARATRGGQVEVLDDKAYAAFIDKKEESPFKRGASSRTGNVVDILGHDVDDPEALNSAIDDARTKLEAQGLTGDDLRSGMIEDIKATYVSAVGKKLADDEVGDLVDAALSGRLTKAEGLPIDSLKSLQRDTGRFLSGIEGGSGTKEDPFIVSDMESAVTLIREGKYNIQLSRPEEVATLLDKLQAIAKDAKKKGEKAPVYDLCKVSVPGTNLFCAESKGVPRIEMPQFKTENPTPGSFAANLFEKQRAEAAARGDKAPKSVDIAPAFFDYLETERGINVEEPKMVKASTLRASQNELDGAKVANIMGKIESGKREPGSIIVTSDGYVVDGHHRWAATVALESEGQDFEIEVTPIDMDIVSLLAIGNEWALENGSPPQGVASRSGENDGPKAPDLEKISSIGGVKDPQSMYDTLAKLRDEKVANFTGDPSTPEGQAALAREVRMALVNRGGAEYATATGDPEPDLNTMRSLADAVLKGEVDGVSVDAYVAQQNKPVDPKVREYQQLKAKAADIEGIATDALLRGDTQGQFDAEDELSKVEDEIKKFEADNPGIKPTSTDMPEAPAAPAAPEVPELSRDEQIRRSIQAQRDKDLSDLQADIDRVTAEINAPDFETANFRYKEERLKEQRDLLDIMDTMNPPEPTFDTPPDFGKPSRRTIVGREPSGPVGDLAADDKYTAERIVKHFNENADAKTLQLLEDAVAGGTNSRKALKAWRAFEADFENFRTEDARTYNEKIDGDTRRTAFNQLIFEASSRKAKKMNDEELKREAKRAEAECMLPWFAPAGTIASGALYEGELIPIVAATCSNPYRDALNAEMASRSIDASNDTGFSTGQDASNDAAFGKTAPATDAAWSQETTEGTDFISTKLGPNGLTARVSESFYSVSKGNNMITADVVNADGNPVVQLGLSQIDDALDGEPATKEKVQEIAGRAMQALADAGIDTPYSVKLGYAEKRKRNRIVEEALGIPQPDPAPSGLSEDEIDNAVESMVAEWDKTRKRSTVKDPMKRRIADRKATRQQEEKLDAGLRDGSIKPPGKDTGDAGASTDADVAEMVKRYEAANGKKPSAAQVEKLKKNLESGKTTVPPKAAPAAKKSNGDEVGLGAFLPAGKPIPVRTWATSWVNAAELDAHIADLEPDERLIEFDHNANVPRSPSLPSRLKKMDDTELTRTFKEIQHMREVNVYDTSADTERDLKIEMSRRGLLTEADTKSALVNSEGQNIEDVGPTFKSAPDAGVEDPAKKFLAAESAKKKPAKKAAKKYPSGTGEGVKKAYDLALTGTLTRQNAANSSTPTKDRVFVKDSNGVKYTFTKSIKGDGKWRLSDSTAADMGAGSKIKTGSADKVDASGIVVADSDVVSALEEALTQATGATGF